MVRGNVLGAVQTKGHYLELVRSKLDLKFCALHVICMHLDSMIALRYINLAA